MRHRPNAEVVGTLAGLNGGEFGRALTEARRRHVFGAPLRRQDRGQVVNSLGEAFASGWSVEDWRSPESMVAKLSLADLRRVTAGCLDEVLVWVRGPKEGVGDAVATVLPDAEVKRFVLPPRDDGPKGK